MLHSDISLSNPNRSVKRNVSGVLLLDKPYGISSNKAVQMAKRVFSATKCGHTGTLDPMATGLLPLCFGEATKFSSVLLGADKTYEATLKLGFSSTTGDAEGEITQSSENIAPTLSRCEQVLKCFTGRIRQVPPMYSALKHQGKPLYVYARKGEAVERSAREVFIDKIQLNLLIENELKLTIQCGTGTYIRTLAEDIGKALGCGGAYLTQLRRTAIDRFDLPQSQTLPTLEALDATDRDKYLLPVDSLLQKFPAIILDELASLHILQGRIIFNPLDASSLAAGHAVRLYDHQQQFLGLGEITGERKIAAKRLLANS
jgi:tRNA pseudouridine55 synthase